jgi:hypothetical protein
VNRRAYLGAVAVAVAAAIVAAVWVTLDRVDAAPGGGPPAPARTSGVAAARPAEDPYDAARRRLHAYFADACGPAPSARSCDWAVRHQHAAVADSAIVTGATTSESQNLAFASEMLSGRLSGDADAMRGILDYIPTVAMPHDGRADPPATSHAVGAPYFPVLAHWLVDVDGGTRMADTGTVVGPNTPYLAREHHPGEAPPDPGPDRESYVGPDDYKYASAPDADQWLADGLQIAYALYGDPAYRDLATRMTASLRERLTTVDDFRYGVVDDLEAAPSDRWWTYASDRSAVAFGPARPGADGTGAAVAVTYTVPWSGMGGIGREVGQDWSPYTGLALAFRGDGGGNAIRIVLTDPLSGTVRLAQDDVYEYFEHVITDTVAGWRTIEVPFSAFHERADWPADWATNGNGVLDLDRVRTLALEPLPGTFADDFEYAEAPAWWSYADAGASLTSGAGAPGAGGSGRALWVTYTLGAGNAGVGASPGADWRGQQRLAFDLFGMGTGNGLSVGLAERGGERWVHLLRDDVSGWRAISIPLAVGDTAFVAGDWQPDGAVVDGKLDLGAISDVVFEPTAGGFRLDFEDGDASDWWTYDSDDGSSVEADVGTPGAADTSRALHLDFDIRTDGWAGAGVTVDGDWRRYDGLRLWLRGEGSVRLVLKDEDDEAFTYTVDRLRPTWTEYRPRWADFDGPVERGGNRRLDLQQVRAFIIEAVQEGLIAVDVDEITLTGAPAGPDRFALDNVRVEGGPVRTGAGTMQVDEIRLMGDPGLPIYPNVMPFSLQWDQDGPIAWTGPIYTGYQDPATYCLAGDSATAGDIVAFLRDAQVAYDDQVPEVPNAGPFMPVFVQDLTYAGDGRAGWTWDGTTADPNTEWAQFQYRTFARLALYYYLSGDPAAWAVLDRFQRWLGDVAVDEAGAIVGLPIGMVAGTEDVELAYRAGDFALAGQGLLWLGARTGSAPLRARARDLVDTLVERQDVSGAFPSLASDGALYGYEQAEVGIALALYDLLPGGSRPDPFLGAMRGEGCRQVVRRAAYLPALWGGRAPGVHRDGR